MKFFFISTLAVGAVLLVLVLNRLSTPPVDSAAVKGEAVHESPDGLSESSDSASTPDAGTSTANLHNRNREDREAIAGAVEPIASKDGETPSSNSAYNEAYRLQEEERERARKHGQWLESRRGWIDSFPYKPTYNPDLRYTPSMLGKDNPYPKEQIDDLLSEAEKETSQVFQEAAQRTAEIEKEWEKSNAEIADARHRVWNHAYLRQFYQSNMRFTKEFEQVHGIMKDFGYEDNTRLVAELYDLLRNHHRTAGDSGGTNHRRLMVEAMLGIAPFVNGEPKPTKQEAYAILERLIKDIDGEGILEIDGMFFANDKYIDELKEGDPLLYR